MPKMADQYSINEEKKPEKQRVYHNNSDCGPFKEIHPNDRRYGQNGYRPCEDCKTLNNDGK